MIQLRSATGSGIARGSAPLPDRPRAGPSAARAPPPPWSRRCSHVRLGDPPRLELPCPLPDNVPGLQEVAGPDTESRSRSGACRFPSRPLPSSRRRPRRFRCRIDRTSARNRCSPPSRSSRRPRRRRLRSPSPACRSGPLSSFRSCSRRSRTRRYSRSHRYSRWSRSCRRKSCRYPRGPRSHCCSMPRSRRVSWSRPRSTLRTSRTRRRTRPSGRGRRHTWRFEANGGPLALSSLGAPPARDDYGPLRSQCRAHFALREACSSPRHGGRTQYS